MKIFKTLFVVITLVLTIAGAAAGQTTTTYTVPSGTDCGGSINGCTLHNLTATAPDGTTLYGWFAGGTYWTQFDYQAFPGQNPAYKATYCPGTGTYVESATPDLGPTAAFFTLDCQGTPDGTSSDGPVNIHVELQAHSYVVTYVRGIRVRTFCHQTHWAIDDGTVSLAPVVQASANIVGRTNDRK
jgi:hypothetical protein